MNLIRKCHNAIVFFFKRRKSHFAIHKTVTIWNKPNVTLAQNAQLFEYVIIRAVISKLTIGQNSQVGPFTVIITGESNITIGANVMIAPHCVLASGLHEHRKLDTPMRFAGSFSRGPIVIGDDVWIGANCTIGDNVTIGKGAIISANSFVNRDVEEFAIVSGVPAKPIGSRLKNQTVTQL